MLLTIHITESETRRWSEDPELRAELKADADRRAYHVGRRFWQVAGSNGRLLAVGETGVTAVSVAPSRVRSIAARSAVRAA